MLRLIPFELCKIWRKRSFALSISILLLIHIFLMWYTSLPNEETPPLAAYKALQMELGGKSEREKGEYIKEWKDTIDGVCFVRDILAMQGFQNEMGSMLAEQEMQNHPGVFERFFERYESGGYLRFTDSLELEKNFVDEIYGEQQSVAGYGEYLRSIQENRDVLDGISIFKEQDGASYSGRNLQKSAEDYAGLTDQNVRFAPSKGITSAMQSIWTDLLLFLGVMLFVGGLITEEKEKGLFYITRSTRRGVFHNIASRLAALLIHCTLVTALFYLVSMVFFGQSTGWFDPTASLQSLSAYMESSLSISILGYVLISVLTKAFLLFGIGAVLMICCILSRIAVLPYLAGAGILAGSALVYVLIPSGSFLAVLKYSNPVGMMRTEHLYGEYLNFSLFGYPVSRMGLSLLLILLLCAAGIGGSVWTFCRMQSFGVQKLRLPFAIPFRPHSSILRHEAYKLLITNRGFVILCVFAGLLAYKSFDRTYTPSVAEEYYRDLMTELEGELTEEKEAVVLSEKLRYEEALREIERIDCMVSEGSLSADAADTLKVRANMTLAFYQAFQRVEAQYDRILEEGGSFVYDTGYLYLFGAWEDVFSIDFLILSIGIILAVSGAISMEYQSGLLLLLCATRAGKKRILFRKAMICAGMTAVLGLVPIISRLCHIASVYPMHSLGASIQSIPHFAEFVLPLPIGCFLLLFLLSQIAALLVVTAVTLALSVWRENQAQTIFFALQILAVPIVVKLLGFELAKWFSVYPLYAWTGML